MTERHTGQNSRDFDKKTAPLSHSTLEQAQSAT